MIYIYVSIVIRFSFIMCCTNLLIVQGITQLLARIETNCRLEHVALVSFSSTAEVLAPFTRDIDLVRSKLASVTAQDKSLLEAGLGGAVSLVLDEWGGGATASLDLNMVNMLRFENVSDRKSVV